MPRHALLLRPSANRVYASGAGAMTCSELSVLTDAALPGRVAEVREEEVAGLPCVGFQVDGALDERTVRVLSDLSSVYALFEVHQDDEGPLLRPVALRPCARHPEDLVTTLRYLGKTNEQFTTLLLGVTVAALGTAPGLVETPLRVLDPLCGRGTTVNQALRWGFDAYGVEGDRTDVAAYATFLSTWLKNTRLKHALEHGPLRRDRKVVAQRLHATFAATKDEWKAGVVQEATVYAADTTATADLFDGQKMDVVVADLPYGVQHGSRTAATGLRRSPLDLLREALPAWLEVLRPGGAVGLAWNTNVTRRTVLVQLLEDAGLAVQDSDAHRAFAHRVDSAVRRDLVVAVTPGG